MHDVIVIGAGPAGLQCARSLAMRGLRPLLLDRRASVADQIRTTGIFVRKTWEDFPLPDELLGKPLRDVVLYSPARRALRLHSERDEFRVGRMAWLYLYLLEQAVRAGTTWMPNTRVIGLEPLREATIVTIERHGRREQLAARYIVGADGARSLTARHLGLDRNRELLVGAEDVRPSDGASEPSMHCYLDPRLAPGYIAWVIDDGAEVHSGVAGYPDRFQPAAALREFLGGRREGERRGGLIPVGGILTNIANRNGLLVGDAAGAVSPLTAGGLDAALRLSSFAAEVIAAHLDGRRGVLREYTGDRFAARFMTRRWMRHIAGALANRPAMELACALMRTPLLRGVAEHVFFSRGSFPDASLAPVPA